MKSHMKSISAPKSWLMPGKRRKFTARPKPGAHSFSTGISLGSAMRILGYAKTMREIKKILLNKEVLIDGKRRKNANFLIGLMDSLQAGEDAYRLVLNQKEKLVFEKIGKDDAKKKLCRIKTKYAHRSRVFLGLHDGRTLEGKKEYKTGDTVEISVPEQKITSHFRLEKGMRAYMTGGRHTGETAEIQEVLPGKVVLKGKTVFEAPKKSVFVMGKNKGKNE